MENIIRQGIRIGAFLAVGGVTLWLSACKSERALLPTTDTLRAIQVGDFYEYTLRGSALAPEMEPEDALPVSGTLQVSVSEGVVVIENAPVRTLRFNYQLTLRLGDANVFQDRYALHYVQRRNPRDLILVAHEDAQGGIEVVDEDVELIAVPGAWFVGYSQSYNTQIGARPLVFNCTVIGREVVQVPRGKFNAWKVTLSNTLRPNDPIVSAPQTIWYVPNLGMPILYTLNTPIEVDGKTYAMQLRILLTGTTVPVPESNL
jgi:hypothetical protein